MPKKIVLLFVLLLAAASVRAQQAGAPAVSGRVADAAARTPLPGVHVLLVSAADSTRRVGGVTDSEGAFRLRAPGPGDYRLRFTFVGYRPAERSVRVTGAVDAGTVTLEEDVLQMGQVSVEATQERVVVKGDTTEYNAAAFKVRPDASAADLVSKMPGITTENGTVQAGGETVRRVLVDGEEFFGEDATLALKNLPAEIVERVQVFDRLSEQARFTGFDDGNPEKTINIVTRNGRNNGRFGKVAAGYGTEGRYLAGGNVSFFDGSRRISTIGLTNNVNQQNFATEDLLGVVGGEGGGGRGGRGGGRGGRGGGGRGGADAGNFLVGQQGGINATNAAGVNYADRWGERVRLSGSYFFNTTENVTDALLDREYFLNDEETQRYAEDSYSESDNFNHRLNMRVEVELDRANSLVLTPRLSFQRNASDRALVGVSSLSERMLSRTVNDFLSENSGYSSSTNLLFRHRFGRPGRTFSANAGYALNDRSGGSDRFSSNAFYDLEAVTADSVYDQRTRDERGGFSLSSNLAFTEPVGEQGQLQVEYAPSFSQNQSDREARRLDPVSGLYSDVIPLLSNRFDNAVLTQRGGVSYRRRGERTRLSVGLNYQHVRLSGDQIVPTLFGVERSFHDLLPTASFQYQFSRARTLRLNYRTSTDVPSVNQLQDVLDNTNPLFLSAGNPELLPSYTHALTARYNATDPRRGRTFLGFVSLGRTRDYIGNETFLARADTLLRPGVLLQQGAQFSRPANLGGQWSARSFFTLGWPVSPLKSNLNLNAGLSYGATPALLNDARTLSRVTNLNGGLVLGSNVSERLDFTLSYSANLNLVSNTADPARSGRYVLHGARGQLSWLPSERFLLETDLGLSRYAGMEGALDESVVLWNAAVGYRFLQDRSVEVRLAVADLLDQNDSLSRTVNERYVEDSQTLVLGRYAMVNVAYRLKHFRL